MTIDFGHPPHEQDRQERSPGREISPAEIEDLEREIERIWGIARKFGLDPFPTHFEIVPPSILYEFGAYLLPGRFSHWTHGRAYQQMKTMYDYGLSKIYELVVNTNPCYAFLMEANSVLQNKLVVAHVLAHCDFFKNNVYFGGTQRQMIEAVSVNADRIRQYEFEQGTVEVEQFLDAVLSIDEHIDPLQARRPRPIPDNPEPAPPQSTPYDDLFELEDRAARRASMTMDERRKQAKKAQAKIPPEPDKDILGFIAQYAPGLEEWQRDIVNMVRAEALYFVPQMQTKIMNEGWASYWHARIMRELDLPTDQYAEFAAMHASVLEPGGRRINPYYVGYKMFEYIERRWNHPTAEEREKFGRTPDQGRTKIFEVREIESDTSFLRNYLTEELVDELDLYLYKQEGDRLVIVEKDWHKVRDMLVDSMTNFGQPYIVVEDGDWNRNRELYLKHAFDGRDLDMHYARKTMSYIYKLWGRPIHLETIQLGERVLLSYDGDKHSEKTLM